MNIAGMNLVLAFGRGRVDADQSVALDLAVAFAKTPEQFPDIRVGRRTVLPLRLLVMTEPQRNDGAAQRGRKHCPDDRFLRQNRVRTERP